MQLEENEVIEIETNERIYKYISEAKRRGKPKSQKDILTLVQLLYGGNGSGKSHTLVQQFVLEEWQKWTGRRFGCFRKYLPQAKRSVYKNIINQLNLYGIEYEENKTENTIWVNGNEIMYLGLYDSENIKSTDFNVIWMEEASEFTLGDLIELNKRCRLPEDADRENRLILTFNPISKLNYIYRTFFAEDKNYDEHNFTSLKTTYKDNKFINPKYANYLESLYHTDYEKWRVSACGEWGTEGQAIFRDKVKIKKLDKENIKCDSYRRGVDFGWEDPNVCLDIGINHSKKEIYIFNEVYKRHLTVAKFGNLIIKEMGVEGTHIADTSPDRIAILKDLGFYIKKVKKTKGVNGKDFKKDCIDFLQGFTIYIDGKKCPNAIEEIMVYGHKKDPRSGEYIDELQTENDHTIDALIYATSEFRRKGRLPKFGFL